jgi:DNA polymerase III delta prime subunit
MADDEYLDIDEEPDRSEEVGSAPTAINFGQSAAETEGTSPNDSDLQTTYKALLPKLKQADINELMQLFMVSRIFPDTYLNKKFLTVMSLKRRHPEIPIMDLENYVDSAMSIGYMGKARLEIVVVQGRAGQPDENSDNGGY